VVAVSFKVDNLRRFFRARGNRRAKNGDRATIVNDVLMKTIQLVARV
jgi:hypothetical protein